MLVRTVYPPYTCWDLNGISQPLWDKSSNWYTSIFFNFPSCFIFCFHRSPRCRRIDPCVKRRGEYTDRSDGSLARRGESNAVMLFLHRWQRGVCTRRHRFLLVSDHNGSNDPAAQQETTQVGLTWVTPQKSQILYVWALKSRHRKQEMWKQQIQDQCYLFIYLFPAI